MDRWSYFWFAIVMLACLRLVLGQNGSGPNGTDKMVHGQNGIGQNGMDKMARTKWHG